MTAKTIAIIPAAGLGARFGPQVHKTFVDLMGKPVIVRTIQALAASSFVDEIIPVLREQDLEEGEKLFSHYGIGKIRKVVPGGTERHESVRNGIAAVEDAAAVVLIHDGVRPMVGEDTIRAVLHGLKGYEGCICAVSPKDTIKELSSDGLVTRTLRRGTLKVVQTPQAFTFEVISEAYRKAASESFSSTDDAALVERYGGRINVVEGSYENIKITTPEDLVIAEAFLRKASAVAGDTAL